MAVLRHGHTQHHVLGSPGLTPGDDGGGGANVGSPDVVAPRRRSVGVALD